MPARRRGRAGALFSDLHEPGGSGDGDIQGTGTGTPPEFGVLRTRSLLQPRVGAVLALVDPALGGNVEAVHDFRVAARSLRAALRTLARRPDGALVGKTSRTLRAAIRALAGVRDRDVGASLIGKSRAGSTGGIVLKRRILGLSDSDRRLALSRAQNRWPQNLDRLLVRLLAQGEPGLKAIIRRTQAEAWRQRRRALDLIQDLGRRRDPDQLHDLRVRIRRLRYALEVLAEVDRGANVRLMRLKPLQSALGSGQDRIVLSRWLFDHARRCRRNDPELASALGREAARWRRQSQKAHAAFVRLRARNILERLALHVDPLADATRTARAVRTPRVRRAAVRDKKSAGAGPSR